MSKNVGREKIFNDKFVKVQILEQLAAGQVPMIDGKEVSCFLMNQMRAGVGYVDWVNADREPGKRGRTPKKYVITPKGRNYLRLSKNWFKPVEKTGDVEVAA